MELKSIDGIETPDWNSVRLALVGKIGDRELTAQYYPVVIMNRLLKRLI